MNPHPKADNFERPSVTVDVVIFAFDPRAGLKVMLVRRGVEPFRGRWALPGGFVRPDETIDAAARRELEEETGLRDVFLEQLYTFGDPGRDPRERVITVAHYALVASTGHAVKATGDAAAARWFDADGALGLAFDHNAILAAARERLRGKVRYQPIGFELLPDVFPLRDLQRLYEVVLGRELDKRNFRKKILQMNVLRETAELETDVRHRPSRLYAFDRDNYRRLTEAGFNFEV